MWMSREHLAKMLRGVADGVECGDSLEGSIEYTLPNEGEDQDGVQVYAAYRTGNLEGQAEDPDRWMEEVRQAELAKEPQRFVGGPLDGMEVPVREPDETEVRFIARASLLASDYVHKRQAAEPVETAKEVPPLETPLAKALLDLGATEYTDLIKVVDHERQRRVFAAIAAARLPGLINLWEREVAKYGEKPYCRDFTDGMDGFFIHTRECPNWPKGYTANDRCINMTKVRA